MERKKRKRENLNKNRGNCLPDILMDSKWRNSMKRSNWTGPIRQLQFCVLKEILRSWHIMQTSKNVYNYSLYFKTQVHRPWTLIVSWPFYPLSDVSVYVCVCVWYVCLCVCRLWVQWVLLCWGGGGCLAELHSSQSPFLKRTWSHVTNQGNWNVNLLFMNNHIIKELNIYPAEIN